MDEGNLYVIISYFAILSPSEECI